MPLVAAHELDIDCGSVQVYNAMDSMLTMEVLAELKTLLPGANAPQEQRGPKLIYDFERALQAPAIEMMLRGWRVDPWARETGIAELRRRLTRLSVIIDTLAAAVWDQRSPTKSKNDYPKPKILNPDSSTQLQKFFYGCMQIPPIGRSTISKDRNGNEVRKYSMERDILEKLEQYFIARPIVAAILAYRDICSQLEVLESEIDDDWRMRCSYNAAMTTTGRFSSSKSITGSGRNMQNIEEDLRYMFIADSGKKLMGADLEQVESRDTGWLCGILFNDWSYLDSVESGDAHTALARETWPHLNWNGDKYHDREVADTVFYRHYSYRDTAKRIRHGTEKKGEAQEISRQLRMPVQLVRQVQNKIFELYPLQKLFTWVAGQLQREHYLINAFGRRRDFFGRADSNDTIKEGVAFMSQSPTADRLNLGMWRVWRYMGPDSSIPFELLAQLHDAVYGQRSELDTDEAEVAAEIRKHLDVPLSFRGRTLSVPSEVKVGWCWSNAYEFDKEGKPVLKWPDGLIKLSPNDTRSRTNLGFANKERKVA